MFVEYLSLVTAVTVLIFAFMEGKKVGSLGISVGLVLGVTIGLAAFLGTRAALRWACQRFNLYEPNLPPLRMALSWSICLGMFIWIPAWGCIVAWVTRHIIQFVK